MNNFSFLVYYLAYSQKTMTKEEVEKLLRHGAYDIFSEDKLGNSEKESNDFMAQDIDSILERRSKTVIHENTGSKSNACGGTFSKASYKASKVLNDTSKETVEDVDIDDPEFWTKMVGEPKIETNTDFNKKRTKRKSINYSEMDYFHDFLSHSGTGSENDSSVLSADLSSDDSHNHEDSTGITDMAAIIVTNNVNSKTNNFNAFETNASVHCGNGNIGIGVLASDISTSSSTIETSKSAHNTGNVIGDVDLTAATVTSTVNHNKNHINIFEPKNSVHCTRESIGTPYLGSNNLTNDANCNTNITNLIETHNCATVIRGARKAPEYASVYNQNPNSANRIPLLTLTPNTSVKNNISPNKL